MILLTKQLKVFRAASSSIKQNNIIPVLSFLKFNNGTITKNNSQAFVIMDADFEGSCLIDERRLYGFLDKVTADTIEVKIKGESIVLTSAGIPSATYPTDDIGLFPDVESGDATPIDFPSAVMYAIKVASLFTIENESNAFTECVFIGNGIVSASNNFSAYVENVAKGMPEIILHRDTCAAITKFEKLSFSQSETYQFFSLPGFKYGFSKKETKFIDMSPYMKNLPSGDRLQIDKDEIINFCDICVSSMPPGRILNARIEPGRLIMEDGAHSVNVEHPLAVELPDFGFNPSVMGKMLKSLPDQEVCFIKGPNKYYITGVSGFIALIMEMKL